MKLSCYTANFDCFRKWIITNLIFIKLFYLNRIDFSLQTPLSGLSEKVIRENYEKLNIKNGETQSIKEYLS